MSANISNSPDLSQNRPVGTIPPLPANRYHLEQLLRDLSKVIEAGEELFTAHRYERHVMEEDVLSWRKDYRCMSYSRRLQESDLIKWRLENGLLECQEHSHCSSGTNLGYAPDLCTQPTMEIVSYLYHTHETATLGEELVNISDQCKQFPQLHQFSDPEALEEFINLGKRITELCYKCDMNRLYILRKRIYQHLELLDQEAPSQPSHSAPEDDPASGNQKLKKVNEFAKGVRLAYLSYALATGEQGKDPTDPKSHVYKELTDKEAYEFLKEYDFTKLGREEEFYDYKLTSFDSWSRQLRTARAELEEQKQEHRYKRPHGCSVVSPDEI